MILKKQVNVTILALFLIGLIGNSDVMARKMSEEEKEAKAVEKVEKYVNSLEKKLLLEESQKTEIKKILEKNHEKIYEIMKESREKARKIRAGADEKILKVLNKPQKKKYLELQAKRKNRKKNRKENRQQQIKELRDRLRKLEEEDND